MRVSEFHLSILYRVQVRYVCPDAVTGPERVGFWYPSRLSRIAQRSLAASNSPEAVSGLPLPETISKTNMSAWLTTLKPSVIIPSKGPLASKTSLDMEPSCGWLTMEPLLYHPMKLRRPKTSLTDDWTPTKRHRR